MARKNPYDDEFLEKIKNNTENNSHTENVYLISKKGNLSTKEDAKKLYSQWEKKGYLDSKMYNKKNSLYKKNLNEIEKKYGKSVKEDIYESL